MGIFDTIKKYIERTRWKLGMIYSELPVVGNPFETAKYAKLLKNYDKVPSILDRINNTTLYKIEQYKEKNPSKYKKGIEDLNNISNEYLQKELTKTQEKIKKGTAKAQEGYNNLKKYIERTLKKLGYTGENTGVGASDQAKNSNKLDNSEKKDVIDASDQAKKLNEPNNIGRPA